MGRGRGSAQDPDKQATVLPINRRTQAGRRLGLEPTESHQRRSVNAKAQCP